MTMGDIHNYIPPRSSWECIGVLFGVGVKPLKISLSVPIVTSLMIQVSGTFYPCGIIVGWFVFVFAVGVAVAVIVPMFGTVVNYLVPVVSFAVFLHIAWFG